MAPSRPEDPRPTYHVVPRFDIVATGGALELGTIVEDLRSLRPLNRGAIPRIPPNRRYPTAEHRGFTETRSRLREGHGGIWAKSLFFSGAGADASAQRETETTVSCDAIVTTYFDPDRAYVAQSLANRDVHEYIVGSGYEDDVYMITGLKVAKGLRYSSTTAAQRAGNVQVAGTEPNTGTTVGANAGGKANDGHSVGFEAGGGGDGDGAGDIVVGFRVRRYAYEPVAAWNPFNKRKKLVGDDYLTGARMHEEGGKEDGEDVLNYSQVPIEEEENAIKWVDDALNVEEYWVNSID